MQDLMTRRVSRRRLIQLSGITILSVVVEACARAVSPPPGAQPGPDAAGSPTFQPTPIPTEPLAGVNAGKGAPPATPAQPGEVLVTPNADFYTVAYNSEAPALPGDWKLAVGGNLDKPTTLTLDQIKSMPSVEEMRTLECISNPAGGPLISNAVWKGIKMRDLLEQVGVRPNTIEIKLESFDGYSTAIPLDLAMDEHSLLVYQMNGQPLPIEHGKPLRCLWPGRYGMKQPKWLTTITAITDKYLGYWEQQGWSDAALILPNSRIDAPPDNGSVNGPSFDIEGVGFSGADGIAKIEVSWDDAKTWHEASLVRGPSPYVWTVWSFGGANPPSGQATLLSRVTTSDGQMQTRGEISILGDTFPNGTKSMHTVVVNVKAT
jgi:DMSO/TMAO reductase YedYZ molybdopterin-dependent catalytic subunit